MARSDLVLALVRAAVTGDQQMLIATTQSIIAEARSRQHHALADRMESTLQERPPAKLPMRGTHDVAVEQTMPAARREDLIFPDFVWTDFDEILREHQRRDLLRSYGLEPRNRVLLSGGPGTGKTSLASLLAAELMVPLLHVNYAALFGSLLGETAQQLQRVFEFAATRACVLLLDEFDALGKSRDDPFDAGEVKRVLNFMLVRLELMPTHVVIVAATNRPGDLDEAVWRRFQKSITLPGVTGQTLARWIDRANERSVEPFGVSPLTMKSYLRGKTFGELELAFQDIQRQYILSMPQVPMKTIIRRRLGSHARPVNQRPSPRRKYTR